MDHDGFMAVHDIIYIEFFQCISILDIPLVSNVIEFVQKSYLFPIILYTSYMTSSNHEIEEMFHT